MNLTERVLAALDALPGAEPWDVMPGQFCAPQAVTGSYASVRDAHAALAAAGYALSADFVATPPLAHLYDLRTLLRFSAGPGRDVVLVRRLGS